jgi:YggT family protein
LIIVENLFSLLLVLINLYKWAIILAAVVSMLISFNILDTRNRIVWTVADFLYKVTDPALRPIRRVLPNFGGVDISPLIALLLIQYVLIPVVIQLELLILRGAGGAAF